MLGIRKGAGFGLYLSGSDQIISSGNSDHIPEVLERHGCNKYLTSQQ